MRSLTPWFLLIILVTPLHFHNSLGREYCTVRYDQSRHVVVVWRGLVTQDSRTQVWQQLLQVLRTTGCPSLLNNWQEFRGAPSAEQKQWLQEVWDAAATEAGLRYLADVMKLDSLSQDYLHPLYTPGQPRLVVLETGLFYNLLDAYAWLRAKQETRP